MRGRIFASENGPGCDDEMNRIEAGGNYGWRDNYPCDDANPDTRYNTIRPLWYLAANECCPAPTGITVYTGHQIPQWRNHLFMANYKRGELYHFYLNNDRTALTASNIVQGVTANMDLITGPDGAFWYLDGGGYNRGTLKKIVGPGQPVASETPMPAPAPTQTPKSGITPIPGNGRRTFPETGKTISGGTSILCYSMRCRAIL